MRFLFILSITLFSFIARAQFSLGLTQSEIIKQNGRVYPYPGVENGRQLISYSRNNHSKASGRYKTVNTYYFNEKGMCDEIRIFEPCHEADKWIDSFNLKYGYAGKLPWAYGVSGCLGRVSYMQTGKLFWKDNEDNLVIKLEVFHTFMEGVFITWCIDK